MTCADSLSCAHTAPYGRPDLQTSAARCEELISLIALLRGVDVFEVEALFIQDRTFALAGIFPCPDVRIVQVVAQSFAVRRLELLAEMPAARFIAMQRVKAHQLGEFEKVRNAAGDRKST